MSELGDLLTICNGRLTLTTGVPVTTSDVTAATTVYFTPYMGDHISLYDGEEWLFFQFVERSISLSGKTADTNYDVFIYDNSGTPTLESLAWSTATARATAIVRQDGVYVKSGDATRRYLGTIRTTSTTGQCEDSITKRFCWNYCNRVERRIYRLYTNAHTYAVSAWRAFDNAQTSVQVEFIIGVREDSLFVGYGGNITQYVSSSPPYVNVGLNSTGSSQGMNITTWMNAGHDNQLQAGNSVDLWPQLGYNYLCPLEYGGPTGSVPYFTQCSVGLNLRG